MAPTTPMTAGRLYIFDYLTNEADLDDQELNGKTLGTDYCYINLENLRGTEDQEMELVYYPGGKGYHFRYDQDEGTIIAGSENMTKANNGYVRQYRKKHRDNEDDPDYLVWYRGANDFYPFYDEDGTEKEYCRGVFKKIVRHGWSKSNPGLFAVLIQFNEVWS